MRRDGRSSRPSRPGTGQPELQPAARDAPTLRWLFMSEVWVAQTEGLPGHTQTNSSMCRCPCCSACGSKRDGRQRLPYDEPQMSTGTRLCLFQACVAGPCICLGRGGPAGWPQMGSGGVLWWLNRCRGGLRPSRACPRPWLRLQQAHLDLWPACPSTHGSLHELSGRVASGLKCRLLAGRQEHHYRIVCELSLFVNPGPHGALPAADAAIQTSHPNSRRCVISGHCRGACLNVAPIWLQAPGHHHHP